MVAAIVVEGLSSTLGVARQEVQQLYSIAERAFESAGGEFDRRISLALSSDGSSAERASSVASIAYDLTDVDFKRQVLKLLGAISGVGWGASLIGASINSAGASVLILGGSVALPEILALIIGVMAIVYCGKLAISVIREMFAKLSSFGAE